MRIILMIALFCLPVAAFAQKYRGEQLKKEKLPVEFTSAISFNPLALVMIDYTLLLGAEIRIKRNLGIVAEAGYIFASDYMETFSGGNNKVSGFIFRPSARFYVNQRNNFYLQPQIFYKQVTHHQHNWVGMDCDNGVPAYEQLMDYKMRRRVFGINSTAGFLAPLSRKQNIFLDFYFGLGLRKKSSYVVDLPNSCIDNTNRGGIVGLDDGTYPSFPLGIKLMFVIK